MILTQFLDRAVSLYGDKKAVFCEDRAFTYHELNQRVNQLSAGLRELGIGKGDRVACLAPNTVEMLEAFYGIFHVGAIMVPLNTRLKPDDYSFILNHSESKVLLVDQSLYHLVAPIKDKLESVEKILVHYHDGKCEETSYDSWLGAQSSAAIERCVLEETDVCSLLYTSGTTGNPKGVMLTHRNNYLHALSSMHHLRVTDEDVLIHVLPMFHVNGWGSPFYYTGNGSSQVCLRRADPKAIFEAIEQHGATVLHMAPTVLNALLQYQAEQQLKLKGGIRVVIAGSAPPPAFVSRVEKELGWEFIQVYGMTESSPLSTVSFVRSHLSELSEEERLKTKAKAGIPMIATEVKVVDDLGNAVPKDGKSVGELIVRGNGVMKGYWKNEEATMNTIKNGWLHTGDMANVDKYGHIEIVDRKKDVIISGGENISSIEVEGVLYDHPGVLEAAVIAVPHEKWGETPHAFIVLREGHQANEAELIAFSRERLAHFKAITGVTFVSELPKTASGKIQKVHLRDEYWHAKGMSGKYVN